MLPACGQNSKKEKAQEEGSNFSDEVVGDNYVKKFQLTDEYIKKFVSLMKDAQSNEKDFGNSPAALPMLQKYLNKHGFKDMEELGLVYSKVMAGVIFLAAEEANKENNMDEQQRKSIAELEKALESPELSEEQKEGYRQVIKQSKEAMASGGVMEQMRQAAATQLSEEDFKVLRRNYDLLKKELSVK
jgi:DNA-binding transcriptional regulator YhcF (GntR family)